MKKNLSISFVLALAASNFALAHGGHQHQPEPTTSYFADAKAATDKYEFNDGDDHLGHFYIKRTKVGKQSELLVLEQTFHRESGDVTKKTKAKFDTNNNVLSYQFTLSDENLQYHIFAHVDDLEGGENDVERIIINTENGSLASDSFTLNLVDNSDDGGDSEGHHHN